MCTCIFHLHHNISTLETELNIALHNVTNWLTANIVTRNVSKSNLLLFNVGSKPQNKFEIFIDHEQLEQKEYAKYLGIFVDNKLSWKKHIQTTNLKISKGIVIIRKMQHYLQEKQLRNMYNAFNKHFFVLKSKPYKIFAKEFEKTLSDDLSNTPVILS